MGCRRSSQVKLKSKSLPGIESGGAGDVEPATRKKPMRLAGCM